MKQWKVNKVNSFGNFSVKIKILEQTKSSLPSQLDRNIRIKEEIKSPNKKRSFYLVKKRNNQKKSNSKIPLKKKLFKFKKKIRFCKML